MATRKLILGNVITMDEKNPTAQAIVVDANKIEYVGSVEQAKALCNGDVEVLDFTNKYIYPGFLESHTHGIFAGYRNIGQTNLSTVIPPDYDKYREVIKKFIADNPNKEAYMAAGWSEDGTELTHEYLDEMCSNKPLVLNTAGGHACLLNKVAMDAFGVNKQMVEKYGTSLVHVDENGQPNGYICEEPAIKLISAMPMTLQDAKDYILDWQQYIFSKGFTAVADAGADLFFKDANIAYSELEKENKLKLRTFSYLLCKENPEDPKAEVERIAREQKQFSSEHYEIIGVKAFLDGVVESHTGWLSEDYHDEPGYHGNERFNDKKKMVEVIVEASKHNMPVHVHSEADGAVKFMLDCIEEAQKITGDYDQRNALAHLHFVLPQDIQRMASTKSVAVVAPTWTPAFPGVYDNEIKFVGEEKTFKGYPIKSFIDAGATIAFHSDYPVSVPVDVARNIYTTVYRAIPEQEYGGMATQRNADETIDRMNSLKAMTVNIAYQWKKEDVLGTLEKGKYADITVFNANFLEDDLLEIVHDSPYATIVNGEIVYKRS